MSRIGKLPITIPENVDVNCSESEIIVKGKFGTLQTKIPDIIAITQDENHLKVNLKSETKSFGLYMVYIEH
jgi:large subunit ribosomal protein L6